MIKPRFINEWKNNQFRFFEMMYISLDITIGRVGILTVVAAPGITGVLYASVVVLGFGFSMLVAPGR